MSIHALFVMRSGFISGLCTQDDKSSVFSCYDMCHLAGLFKGQFRTAPASWGRMRRRWRRGRAQELRRRRRRMGWHVGRGAPSPAGRGLKIGLCRTSH